MSKIYVFGIGGTGARVIKSLTLLLASGVEINSDVVVPILIDPDKANGDLTRTIELLKNYQQIRTRVNFSSQSNKGFFRTKIEDVCRNFRLDLKDIENDKFRDYIDYSGLNASNKALISLLFSEDNLNSNMEVGFKGNPNIGSVVLNQFKYSTDFRDFASSFVQGDRIFIVSSIFGGTGAAGFPLLLKNIRNADQSLATCALLKDAPVGAITVLPYFGVTPDPESKIDKSTFISKSKAALSYYEENISGNNSLNALYYLGDNITKDYENHEGSIDQQNDAHFIELASALSIIDFMNMQDIDLGVVNGCALNPVYKEFGIKNDTHSINFLDLGHLSQQYLGKSLSQYFLFTLYLKNNLRDSLHLPWATGSVKIDSQFLNQPFYASYLKNFNERFVEWLEEMSRNMRGFAPFNLNVGSNNLFEFVVGISPKISFLEKGSNYARMNHILAKNEPKVGNPNVEQKLMSLFYLATEELVKEKFNF